MNRVAALVLLIGGALLLSWAVAPATSGPAPQRAPVSVERKPQGPSQNMTAEVARLRERLATAPAFPEPSRDPFRFGGRRADVVAVSAPAELVPVETAAPVLPRLVALMDDGRPGEPLWRAVMAMGEDVRIVKAGETVAGFSVKGIGADGVELVDPVSQRSFRLHLK